MYSLLFPSLLTLSLLSFVSAIFFLIQASRRRAALYRQKKLLPESETKLEPESFISAMSDVAQYETLENNPTHLANSRLYELLLSDKMEELDWEEDQGVSAKKKKKKKKKKRGKKKKSDLSGGGDDEYSGEKRADEGDGLVLNQRSGSISDSGTKPEEFVCLFPPLTSTSSATQRKIKQQYDQLVKCNSAKGLTLAQIGEFAKCLVEAKNELMHKTEVIKRKYSITKALLFKADRSSFDRLLQQIFKLEMEHKKVEEDALVYNGLQQQLKLSPAYKKALEISASMKLKNKSSTELDSPEDEFSDISFEELLEQEKKDSFWHKNGKLRTCRT